MTNHDPTREELHNDAVITAFAPFLEEFSNLACAIEESNRLFAELLELRTLEAERKAARWKERQEEEEEELFPAPTRLYQVEWKRDGQRLTRQFRASSAHVIEGTLWLRGGEDETLLLLPASADWALEHLNGEADRLQKPLLNLGAGTEGSSLRAALLGPTLWGDVNLDIAAPDAAMCGPDQVCWGDAHTLPYPDKHFGSAILSHVLEHVDDPREVMAEVQRVTEGQIFVIVPKWWAPHTWHHPGHQWYIDDDGDIHPLWRRDQNEE